MYSSAIRINPNELLNASMPGETRAEARINGHEYPVLTLEKLATTDKAYLGVLVENELNVHSIRECQWGIYGSHMPIRRCSFPKQFISSGHSRSAR